MCVGDDNNTRSKFIYKRDCEWGNKMIKMLCLEFYSHLLQ